MTFHDFWTGENNPTLAKSEYLYHTRHILVLLFTVLACVVLTLIFKNKNEKQKRILFYVLGSILLFFEISSRVVNLIKTNDYSFERIFKILVPMHICSVMVWVFIISIFSKNKALTEFSVVGGLLATMSFLLYPAVGLNRVHMSFDCLYSTLSHAVGFVVVILLLTLNMVNLNIKNIWKTFLCFIVMFCWGVLLDYVIFPGADYMYLTNNPLGVSWNFPYQIVYALVIVSYISLFYLVVWLVDKFKREKPNVIINNQD